MHYKEIEDYSIIRFLATFLVLIGHCTSLTYYGGGYNSDSEYLGWSIKIWNYVNEFIYSFHMPLFFVLSGALFHHKKKNNKYIKERYKRLIYPFVFNAFFVLLPCRIIVGYYKCDSVIIIGQIFKDLFLCLNNSYLWFLICLFVLNIMFFFLEKNVLKMKKITIVILTVLSIIGSMNEFEWIFNLNRVLIYSIWFYLGILYEHYHDSNIFEILNLKNGLIIFLCGLLLFIVKYALLRLNICFLNLIGHGVALLNALAFVFLAVLISRQTTSFLERGFVRWSIKNSFQIYLYHNVIKNYLAYLIVIVIGSYQITNIDYFLLVLLMISLTVILTILTVISINYFKHRMFFYNVSH